MHRKMLGGVLVGVLCVNLVGVVPAQKDPVLSAPKTVASKKVERTFKTAELVEMKYKKVVVLPVVAKSVRFLNQEPLEDVKRVFGSAQSHSQVTKSIMPAVKDLLELVDATIAQFIKSTAIEHKESVKIEFTNEKESVVAELTFKKVGTKITVSVEVSGLQAKEPVYIRNLLTAILADDTLWQRYGVAISVGAGVAVVGLVLGKLWLNKRAEAKKLAAKEAAQKIKFDDFKAKMVEMTNKIARAVLVFRFGSDVLNEAKFTDSVQEGYVLCQDTRTQVTVITALTVEGVRQASERKEENITLIIPTSIFDGGKRVDGDISRALRHRLQRLEMHIVVLEDDGEMVIGADIQSLDGLKTPLVSHAEDKLQQCGLFNCFDCQACDYFNVPCTFVIACGQHDNENFSQSLFGFFSPEYKLTDGHRIYGAYPLNEAYTISCLLSIPGVSALHVDGDLKLSNQHAGESIDVCPLCKKIQAVNRICGIESMEPDHLDAVGEVFVRPDVPGAANQHVAPVLHASSLPLSEPSSPALLRRGDVLQVPAALTAESLAAALGVNVKLVAPSDHKGILKLSGKSFFVVGDWFKAATYLSTKGFFDEKKDSTVAILFDFSNPSTEQPCFNNYILITKPVSDEAGRGVYHSKRGGLTPKYFKNDEDLVAHVQELLRTQFETFGYSAE